MSVAKKQVNEIMAQKSGISITKVGVKASRRWLLHGSLLYFAVRLFPIEKYDRPPPLEQAKASLITRFHHESSRFSLVCTSICFFQYSSYNTGHVCVGWPKIVCLKLVDACFLWSFARV